MNEEYLKTLAERARSLAVVADPFTKQRLLDLARQYDERTKRRHSHPVSLLANLAQARVPTKARELE